MILTIFGASGQVGKRVVSQALAKGFTVKAFGRNIENQIDKDLHDKNFIAVKGYVFDAEEVYNAVKGSDAVISTLGGAFDGSDKTRSLGIKNIAHAMNTAGVKRIVALGGMGVLNATDNTLIIDTPDYPQMFYPVGKEHQLAYNNLKVSNLDWTFVCPPDILNEDETGKYVINADYPPTPNYYKIAAGDLAHFMLNEVTANQFINHRVGISKL
jgi:hypothetical protein